MIPSNFKPYALAEVLHPSPDDQGVVSEDFIKEEICFKSNPRPSVFFTRKSIIISLSRVVRVEFIKCMHESFCRVDRNSTPTCSVLLSSSINHEMQTLARKLARPLSVVHREVQAIADGARDFEKWISDYVF